MDRALQERIIGAVVLVLFVVLVVPVFLDGPDDTSAVISQSVPLPGQANAGDNVIVLQRDRDQPVPASRSTTPVPAATAAEADPPPAAEPEAVVAQQPVQQTVASPAPDNAPQKAVAEDRPEPEKTTPAPAKPATTATPATTSATGMWAVQLGSFGNEANANKLAADLRKQNFAAFLARLTTADGELHRVRIGPLKDRDSAEAVAAELARAGHKGQVVPHP